MSNREIKAVTLLLYICVFAALSAVGVLPFWFVYGATNEKTLFMFCVIFWMSTSCVPLLYEIVTWEECILGGDDNDTR